MIRHRSLRLTFALAVLLPACRTTTRSVTGLAPTTPGDRSPARVAASVRLSLDEHLRAEVRATDAAPAGEAAPALGLAVVFEPKVLGYSFNAAQLVLRDGRGGEWRPTAASAGRMRHGSCESASNAGDPLGGYVPVAPGSCVQVAFDRAVSDGERLELVVAGAAVGRRRLEPVTVALARTEQKSRQADPVLVEMLTLPLKILLFPLAMYGGGGGG